MGDRALEEAMARSEAAALVLERHKAALFPHLAMLLVTFGPANLRSIVAGAVEAVIVAGARQAPGTVIPFAGEADE